MEHDAFIAGEGFYRDHSTKLLINPLRVYRPGTLEPLPAGPKEGSIAYDAMTALKCKKAADGNFELIEDSIPDSRYPLLQLYIDR